MRTKDFIYHHLFGMKAKKVAGMERNDMERVRKGNKLEQISTNLDQRKKKIRKNIQEFNSKNAQFKFRKYAKVL